jgi:hypothetical protein
MLLIFIKKKRKASNSCTILRLMLPSLHRLPSLVLPEFDGKGAVVNTIFSADAHLPGRRI